jgi:quercetin dioxygenase-like cupin family protein
MKEASIILARANTGCVIAWHWHSAGENLMMVSGEARVEMKDGDVVTLRAGGFAQMPAHHVHQFSCVKDCVLFIFSDAALDLHYVDPAGQEISPAAALKSAGETAATPPH